MGKKHQRKRNSHLNSSAFSNEDSENSSCDCFVPSNSFSSEDILPDKFLVSSVEKAKCGTYAKCLKSEWKDVVFLHPHVMRKYEIQDLVLIKGEPKNILCRALPVETLQRNLIVFPKDECLFRDEELVDLQKYEGGVEDAEEIIIKFTKENVDFDENFKDYILRFISDRYIYENLEVHPTFFGNKYSFIITSVNNTICLSSSSKSILKPDTPKFYKVSWMTSLKIEEESNKPISNKVGGLKKQEKLIKDHLQTFFNRSLYFGILVLEGPSGTGKSLLLQTVLEEYNVFVDYIPMWDLFSVSQSEMKQVLKDTFQRAIKNAPSIIVIEDFHNLCPKHNDENLHLYTYTSECLSQCLKTLNDAKVMVIITTIESEYDASVLERCGRLMQVIKFQIPTAEERTEILEKILGSDHDLKFSDISKCAAIAHGFNGKELLEAVNCARMFAIRRENPDKIRSPNFMNLTKSPDFNRGRIKYDELLKGIKMKKNSVVSDSNIKVKKVQWTDIAGVTAIEEKLMEIVEGPLKYGDAYKIFNITPPRGILLYGPPGCSKTMIAKALATECELNFISKKAADLYDKYVGESERAIRDLFAMAKAKSPCIIFLDEIDGLVTGRASSSSSSGVENRILTTLLTEIDGVEELHGVLIIAATNRPDMLDDALVRNGRISTFIYIPLPNRDTREEILRINMRNRSVSEDFDYKALAEKTEGYSGAEVMNVCYEAVFQLLAEVKDSEELNAQIKAKNFRSVYSMKHMESALKNIRPKTNKEMIAFYEAFNKKHSSQQ